MGETDAVPFDAHEFASAAEACEAIFGAGVTTGLLGSAKPGPAAREALIRGLRARRWLTAAVERARLVEAWGEAEVKHLWAEDRMRRLEAARQAVEAAVPLHKAEKDCIDFDRENSWICGPMYFCEEWGYAEIGAQMVAHELALAMNANRDAQEARP